VENPFLAPQLRHRHEPNVYQPILSHRAPQPIRRRSPSTSVPCATSLVAIAGQRLLRLRLPLPRAPENVTVCEEPLTDTRIRPEMSYSLL